MIVICKIPIAGELTLNETYEAELIEVGVDDYIYAPTDWYKQESYKLYRIVSDDNMIREYDEDLFMEVSLHRDLTISKILNETTF